MSLPMPIKGTPYAHQRAGFEFAMGRFGVSLTGEAIATTPSIQCTALLMEMGTGKTLTSIAIAGSLYMFGKINKVLIVAPLSILGVWDDEFSKFADFNYELEMLTGTLEQKTHVLSTMCGGGPLQVAVVNYESMWRLEGEIIDWKPDFIIADESHKIKNYKAKASKAMHKLARRAAYRMILTGTPITNKVYDIFSQYKFLNYRIFGDSFYTFRNKYFDMKGYGNYTPVLKEKLEPELIGIIHSVAYRATKAECLDLPEYTDIVRYVQLEKDAAKTYRDLVKDNYVELKKGEVTTTNVLTKLLRLSQLTGGFLRADDSSKYVPISSSKLKALEDILDGAQNENVKVVIIAHFLHEISAICSLLADLHIKYALVTGEVEDRSAEVDRFQDNPDVTVFVGQIQTAALGITLTAASLMVFYSLDYNMSNYEQARARIHRAGQKNACTYIHIVVKSTIDEKVLKALRDKSDLARALVDDYKNGVNPFE